MPRFTIRSLKAVKEPGVTAALVEKYGKYVQQIDDGNAGVLKFRESEDLTVARDALRAAGEKLGRDLIIRRPRGVPNVLEFRLRKS